VRSVEDYRQDRAGAGIKTNSISISSLQKVGYTGLKSVCRAAILWAVFNSDEKRAGGKSWMTEERVRRFPDPRR
jgi:hypothetical protein